MPHKLHKNNQDISNVVGNISWQSNIDALGVQLEFDLAYSDAPYIPNELLQAGDIIVMTNGNKEIFRGIVIAEDRNGRSPKHFTCMDFAFYLNKSKEVYQFNNIIASQAIMQMLNDFNVPIGSIPNLPTRITYIYKDKEISNIIKDILQQVTNETGNKYRLEMREGKLYIEPYEETPIQATFDLAPNVKGVDITNAISNPTRRLSIEEMKNSIKLLVDDTVIATDADQDNIKKYGLLQEVQSITDKDIAQAKNIAATLLNELNRVADENSIELPGNDDVRSGRYINISEPTTGMNGKYLITGCTHTVTNGFHRMSLELEVA